MNLLHPTTGDLCDRLVILELKLIHAPVRHRHWEAERMKLTPVIGHVPPDSLKALYEVHSAMWVMNDEICAVSQQDHPEPNHLGVQMWLLNQRRIAILEEINQALGEYVGPEKAY